MKALIGPLAIGAIQGVQEIPVPNSTGEIIKLAIQVILGLASLFQMFRKPKNQNSSNSN